MNNLKITLNPYGEYNTASLDGNPLSPYSEISNFIKLPLLNWASELLDAAEREINDDFSLTIVGERFERLFLESLCCSQKSCVSFYTESFAVNFHVEKRFNVIKKLADKYNIEYTLKDFALTFYSDVPMVLEKDILVPDDCDKAFLTIVKDRETAAKAEKLSSAKIIILVSSQKRVTPLKSGKYLWEIPPEELYEVVSATLDRLARIPFIINVSKKLLSCKLLDLHDKEMVMLATSVTPLIKVENIGPLEVGSETNVKLKAVPEGSDIPSVRLESSASHIIEINRLTVKAVSVGQAVISVFKDDEIIPFAKLVVDTFKDNSIKRIILDRKEPNMGIGRTQQIELSVFPANAVDEKYIVWSVDNPSIATVDENGTVTAKANGRVTVTASTPKVSESVIIDVLPNITKITLSSDDIKLLKGDTTPISVICEPSNCFNNGYHWDTSDNNVASVETLSDGSLIVRAKENGTCTLSCIADEGGCSATCNVEVIDPDDVKKQIKKQMSSIDIACMIGIPFAVIVILTILFIIFGP